MNKKINHFGSFYRLIRRNMLLFLFIFGTISKILGQPLLTESFNYPNNTALTSTNWAVYSGSGNTITTSASNLTYPGTIGNGIGNKVALTNTGQDVTRSFTSTAVSTTVPMYVSMVVNITDAKTGDYFFTLGGVPIYVRTNGLGGFNFGVSKTTSTLPSYEITARAFGQYLLVLKYEVATGSNNDVVKLFVNPSLLSEPSTADATYNTASGSDATSFSGISLYQGTSLTSPALEIDNINVGTTWVSVAAPAYDYGDLPVSYDTSKENVFVPAVHAPLTGLYMGSNAPDLELGPYSVTSPDENNTLGDNSNATADEDAIVAASNPIRKGVAYSISVPVKNPSATTRYLYGWIDFNGDGMFQATELASYNAVSFSTNGNSTQTLTWTAAQTLNLSSTSNVYMRLRLSTNALIDTSDATLDERSIGNGAKSTSSTVDAATYSTGEVEDYQIGVIPTFDYGDAPNSYELNKNNVAQPARHMPGSSLYLGSTYDTEFSKNEVAAGADNGGSNGDGADEDGITGTLPQLDSNTTTYTVNVKVYKTIAGTATLHGWIDMDGDGRFSASEYTSATVTGTTGNQTVALTWSSPYYFDTGAARSYMRLRLTTAALADDSTTPKVDERSIGDGLSTGLYTTGTTFANGEIEDYPVPLPAPAINPNLDSDGDGVKDINDLDADNDGIPDSIEGPVSITGSAFKLYNTPTINRVGEARWNLYITGTAGTSINYTPFNGTNTTTTIPATGILAINLTKPQTPDWPVNTVTSGKFVPVTSSAPISIVQEIYGTNASVDAAVVYPPSIWGNKYTISMFNNTTTDNHKGIEIISASNNNNVIIKDKTGTTVKSFTLNDGDNYIYDYSIDLSGYTVTSSQNVAVIIYNLCAAVNFPTSGCDNTLEYLLPDRLLGTMFLSRSAANTGMLQITATQNNTVIKIDGQIVQTLVNAHDTYMYTQNIGSAQIIETNKPVQFIKIIPYDYDPSVTTVQDINKATFGPAKMIIPSLMITNNYLTIFVKTTQTSSMLYNGNAVTGWTAFSADSRFSYKTLTAADGLTPGASVSISSTTGDVPFLTDWYGIGDFITDATPLSIGGVNLISGLAASNSLKDTDGDGIPDYLDLDSDNDGCLDALEGSASISSSNLVSAAGTVTVGTGSTASNRNLCGGSSCVNSQGIPQLTPVPSGYSNTSGQGVGTSIDRLIQSAACLVPPFCYKPAATGGTVLSTSQGITALGRAGSTDTDNWPMARKGAWTALESKEKGFVINRVATTAALANITNPIEGMMVYDQQAGCLKVYTTKEGDTAPAWHCMSTQACPD